MRCRAALSWRLPERLSRIWPAVLPDHTGMGATAAWQAKAASLLNRVTPAASPTILAAVSSAQPGISSSAGATWWTRALMRWARVLISPVSRMMSVSSARASSATNPGWVSSQVRRACWCLAASSERAAGARSGSSSWTSQRNRLIADVRWATRTSRRSVNNFNSRDVSSWVARGRSVSRSTARATASASIGSDLPRLRADLRVWAISLVGTRTTCWPAASRSRSRRADMLRQSSMPQISSRPNCSRAHMMAVACPAVVALTVFSPSWRPTSSVATKVWLYLCASVPTTTMVVASFT
ncbi:Uncharacterised protein [Mycobacterium tuberculosis]|uniref:Orf2 protein n=1 Tax=Mycobacterium tuberculosis TaxID=1773 RepID=O33353_MYCTX|nr:hypothetical protein FI98_03172 [Mycobacterium tuberculosis]KFE91889.1 hypothetical protein FI98_01181 [Mycobacterium tuberculosis]CAA73869.1 orf2 [Mycobacterium tuberculosis]CFD65874.1 Uncharacterised protein [Mycobacterium tuberculosis]CKS84787.1 Uncharacterised protein [Mycobacterium tuberculosis]